MSTDTTSSTDPVYLEMEILQTYPRGWKLMTIRMLDRPKNARDWMRALWGYDIFYGPFPVLKIIVAANLLVWILLLVAR